MKWIQKILYKIEGKDKAYVSEADQMIANFDFKHPVRSESQEKEIQKHQGIFKRTRDQRIKW